MGDAGLPGAESAGSEVRSAQVYFSCEFVGRVVARLFASLIRLAV